MTEQHPDHRKACKARKASQVTLIPRVCVQLDYGRQHSEPMTEQHRECGRAWQATLIPVVCMQLIHTWQHSELGAQRRATLNQQKNP